MGCRGVVRILLEPANGSLLDFIRVCIEERVRGVIATLISTNDGFALPVGSRLFWRDDREFADGQPGQVFDGIRSVILKEIEYSMHEGHSRSVNLSTPQGQAEFFLEIVQPPTTLLIFGAGHDALPLSQFAKQLGWRVKIIDRRPAYADRARFPEADDIFISRSEDLEEEAISDRDSVAVVMSHNFESDGESVRKLLKSPCSYIGILGPKQRTANLLQELAADGVNFDSRTMERIFAPAG